MAVVDTVSDDGASLRSATIEAVDGVGVTLLYPDEIFPLSFAKLIVGFVHFGDQAVGAQQGPIPERHGLIPLDAYEKFFERQPEGNNSYVNLSYVSYNSCERRDIQRAVSFDFLFTET